MNDDRTLIENLLAELHYVHTTNDVADSIKNSREIINEAAIRCGYESYQHYADIQNDGDDGQDRESYSDTQDRESYSVT